MNKSSEPALSRRERQILDILYERGRASAADVMEALPDPPSYSSVRALLRVMEEKGLVRHDEDGRRFIFLPVRDQQPAARSALSRVVQTFFGGNPARAAATLLSTADAPLSDEDILHLQALIDEAKSGGQS